MSNGSVPLVVFYSCMRPSKLHTNTSKGNLQMSSRPHPFTRGDALAELHIPSLQHTLYRERRYRDDMRRMSRSESYFSPRTHSKWTRSKSVCAGMCCTSETTQLLLLQTSGCPQ